MVQRMSMCLLLLFAVSTASGEQVAPPNDQGKLHLSVVGASDDSQFQKICGWFNADANLARYKSGVHYHAITTDSVIFQQRYQPNIKSLPTVRLQNPDGVVIYERSGILIPGSSTGLYTDLVLAPVKEDLFIWRQGNNERGCPPFNRCRPKPQPEPEPELTFEIVVQPEPTPPAPASQFPWMLVIIGACVLGVVLGVAAQWRKTHKGK